MTRKNEGGDAANSDSIGNLKDFQGGVFIYGKRRGGGEGRRVKQGMRWGETTQTKTPPPQPPNLWVYSVMLRKEVRETKKGGRN